MLKGCPKLAQSLTVAVFRSISSIAAVAVGGGVGWGEAQQVK